ncbi:MAG: YciC family protein [Buchnera aphidicola (Nurudea yanoniella)]
MHITENLLYRDTINFLKIKWLAVFIISLLSSSITIILEHIFLPNANILTLLYESKINQNIPLFEFLKTLTFDQQRKLLFFLIQKLCSSLAGSAFLIGTLTIFIQSISLKKENFFLKLKNVHFFLYVNLFLLMFIITAIVQIGLIFLVIPGIICFIFLSLSPIILIIKNTNIIESIFSSIKIAFNNFKIIFPAVMLWFFSKLIILITFSNLKIIPELILLFLLNTILNLISSILVIYLFRLYMLLSFPQYFK